MSKQIKAYEIYFNQLNNLDIMDIILYWLYKLNICGIFNKLIFKLESQKFGYYFPENTKLIYGKQIDLDLLSIGIANASMIFRTKPLLKFKLKLRNGLTLTCADTHRVYARLNDDFPKWEYVCDLTKQHKVLTKDGYVLVKYVKDRKEQEFMMDFSVDNKNVYSNADFKHAFFTNDILSHNTTTTVCFLLWNLLFHPDRTALVVANKYRTGKEIISKMKEVLLDLPYFLKPGILNLSVNKLKFENGSSVTTAAASSSPATGDSLNLLYIDEAALIPGSIIDEYWASVYPTLSSFRGSLIILSSTPRGKGNLFYKFYMGGLEKTLTGWVSNRVDWWEVPEHDENWLNQLRLDLGDELFQREVELSFETVSGRLISNKTVMLMNRIKKQFVTCDFYQVPLEISNNIIWHPDFHPDLLTYNDLLNRRFILSIDLAQGIEAGAAGKKDSDYNIINIFEIELMSPYQIERNRDNQPISTKDVIQYKLVGLYMDNLKDEARCAEAAKYITFNILKSGFKQIDNTRILLETNFNGQNWLTHFKSHPTYYGGLIIKTPNGERLDPNKPIKYMFGYRTKSGSKGKNYWCEKGANMLNRRQIIVQQCDDDNINHSSQGELFLFGKSDKGVYLGNACHDDIAITTLFLGIAHTSTPYVVWINDWIESLPSNSYKVNLVKQMLDLYIEREASISSEQTKDFYKAAGRYFGQLTYLQNGYGSLMNNKNQPSAYYISH